MNTNDHLSQRLQEWRLKVSASQEFRPEVWKKIATVQRNDGLAAFGRARVGMIGAACLMTVVLTGWSGHAYARSRVQAERDALATSYLSSLDARVHTGLHK